MDVKLRSMRTAEFSERRRSGRADGVTVHARTALAGDEVVLGLVTPKRIGTAVARNRARRRTRALFAEWSRDGAVPPGSYVVVFTGTPPTEPDEFAEMLRSALRRALRRRGR